MIYLIKPCRRYSDDIFLKKYATNEQEIAKLAAYYWEYYLHEAVADIKVDMDKMEVTANDADDAIYDHVMYICAVSAISLEEEAKNPG